MSAMVLFSVLGFRVAWHVEQETVTALPCGSVMPVSTCGGPIGLRMVVGYGFASSDVERLAGNSDPPTPSAVDLAGGTALVTGDSLEDSGSGGEPMFAARYKPVIATRPTDIATTPLIDPSRRVNFELASLGNRTSVNAFFRGFRSTIMALPNTS